MVTSPDALTESRALSPPKVLEVEKAPGFKRKMRGDFSPLGRTIPRELLTQIFSLKEKDRTVFIFQNLILMSEGLLTVALKETSW